MSNKTDEQYLSLLRHVMEDGVHRPDRTGTGTYGIFGHQMRFNLQDGFPMLTTKKLHWKSIVYELLWFLRGDTNIRYLNDNGVRIWDEWADENGDLGPVYGKQWRQWDRYVRRDYTYGEDGEYVDSKIVELPPVDQIAGVVTGLKDNPYGRRHIVTAWNPADVEDMALPPCHLLFQFYVTPSRLHGRPKLSCQLYQRSVDIGLGLPFNIASYALLTHMIAEVCDYDVGDFIHTSGDAHVYVNHFQPLEEQLDRKPFALPTLNIVRNVDSIDDFQFEDFQLLDYEAHPNIKMKVAV